MAEVLVFTFLPLSLAVIMFSLGNGLVVADFRRVAARRFAFAVGAVNQVIVLPAVAFLVALLFALPGEIAVGLMILAACPGGVTSNLLTKFAGGDVALSISLDRGHQSGEYFFNPAPRGTVGRLLHGPRRAQH